MKNQESLRIFHPSDTYDFINGQLILADKPEAWTSFDVVNYCRSTIRKYHEIKKIKVGHAGTLDPFASGLLLVCSGPYTKRIDELQNLPKVYSGIMELGGTTPSLDTETEIINKTAYQHINREEILKVKEQFLGEIQQIPPQYSALKINGKPAYKYARKNKEIALQPRLVNIYSFSIDKIQLPEIHFTIKCSKGTYIRAIARDFGAMLDNAAYLKSLKRLSIGDFTLDNAISPQAFRNAVLGE